MLNPLREKKQDMDRVPGGRGARLETDVGDTCDLRVHARYHECIRTSMVRMTTVVRKIA